MSSDAEITTSTPKATASEKVLRENFFDFSMIKREKSNGKFKKPSMRNKAAKENPNRSKPPRSSKHEESELKRRQLAVEAMKIAEQRRQRLAHQDDDDSLCESMANLSVSSVEYLPDGRIKLSRKELAARRDKHRRITEFLTQQEARKAIKYNKRVAYKPKSYRWQPRAVIKLSRPNVIPALKKKTTVKFTDEETQTTKTTEIIRYTADELREICPYGTYFM